MMGGNNRETNQLVVALYGPAAGLGRTEFDGWRQFNEKLAKRLGVELTHFSAGLKMQLTEMLAHESYTLPAADGLLRREIDEDNVNSLWFYSLASEEFQSLASGWQYAAGFTCACEPAQYVVGLALDWVERSSALDLAGLVRDVAEATIGLGRPSYGYASVMPGAHDPVGYAIGLCFGTQPPTIRRDARSWLDVQSADLGRVLRNVHAVNFLTAHHLAIPVERLRLGDWIARDPSRGQLTDFSEGLSLWTFGGDRPLSYDNPSVVTVREALEEQGIFFWQGRTHTGGAEKNR